MPGQVGRALRHGTQAALVAAIFACAHGPAVGVEKPGPPVTVCQPLARETDVVDFTPRLESAELVQVRAPLAGELEKVHVRDGAVVKKGDLLFEIDAGPVRDEMENARAAVRRGEKRLRKLDAAVKKARKKRGARKRVDLDKATAAREVGEVELDVARDNLKRIGADLERRRVTAPLAGRVGQLVGGVGTRVDAGVRSATLLCTVARTDQVRAGFDVDERTLLSLNRQIAKAGGKGLAGVTVRLGLPGEKGQPHKGVLDFVGTRVDRKSGLVHCRAVFPNPSGALDKALFGRGKKTSKRRGRVRVAVGRPREVLLVPGRAVGARPDGTSFVLVVNAKNVVEARKVKVGGQVDGLQAIEGGLKPDAWVVLGTERTNRELTKSTFSPDNLAADLRLIGVKPGAVVTPVRVALPDPTKNVEKDR
jgi:RND family efflux transporter MFP subunit